MTKTMGIYKQKPKTPLILALSETPLKLHQINL